MSARQVIDAAIVGDPEHEGPFGTFTTEPGQRFPYREGDLLQQVVAIA